MKKLIDFDGLFEEKLKAYMQEHADKYSEPQWEALIPKLYKNFSDTFVKSAGNTPKGYYAEMNDSELVETLCAHIREEVPVSDFLLSEIERRRPEGLFTLLKSKDERLVTLAVNLSGDDKRAYPYYFEILNCENEEIKDAVMERLKAAADEVKERAIELYSSGVLREYMLEILSRCREKDDRVFDILLREFRTSPDELPKLTSYLASYGDERALPVLLEYIDREDIRYVEFQELKFAVEALGGEYTRSRDFSEDPDYQEIFSQSQLK